MRANTEYPRLRRGLPGYLILFDPHAFVHERQYQARQQPSLPVFFQISKHFTATPGIPLPSPVFKITSIGGSSSVKLKDFTTDLIIRLRTFTPSKSGQRLPPTYYRGCWHVVSRGLLSGYHQSRETGSFSPATVVYDLKGLHPTRGVAASGFRPLRNIPHCCLP